MCAATRQIGVTTGSRLPKSLRTPCESALQGLPYCFERLVVIASLQNPDTRGQFGNVLPLEYDREQVDGPFGVDLSPQNCESRASAVSEANRRDTVVEKRVMCGAGSLSIQRIEWSSRRHQRVWARGEILRSRGWRQDIDAIERGCGNPQSRNLEANVARVLRFGAQDLGGSL
jgi:hypothetical protein